MRFPLHCVWLRLVAIMLAGIVSRAAHAQTPDSLATLAGQLQRYQQHTLVEKLYGHLDRPVYTARETMWLKLYVVDGTFHKPLNMSKVAYVEVLNSLNQPVLQTQIALRDATGQGSLDLPASLPTGRYVVRAYTSWMKNFDPQFYFHANITIINTFAASGPAPVAATAPAHDVQFFPEGGQLVQGLPSRVAFRVADVTSRGLEAVGTVRDGQGKPVVTFRTLQFGLGSFTFTPTTGAAYTAELQLPTGQKLTYKLPLAAAQGYVLHLTEASTGQLRLQVRVKGMGAEAAVLALVAHSGQHIASTQTARPNAQGEAEFLIDQHALLPGVSHFTVFNSRRQPVGERLYFRRPQPLPISVAPARGRYGPREKVTLRLAVPAASAANVSLAVYQLDSLTAGASAVDISTFLSLTSDLNGTVEDPGYYLRNSSQVGQQAADNLMLTHGWSRFRWSEVLTARPPALPYPPELKGPLVRGRVLTAAGRPASGITTYLAVPSRTARFYTATSRADGTVQFEPKDWVGLQNVTLQTDWRRGDSTYQLSLLSPYSERYASQQTAPLSLGPGFTPDLTRRHVQAQLQHTYFSHHQQYRLPPRDTVAFYGRPPALYNLDDYTRFKVLEEVLREYVQGVYVRTRKDGFHLAVGDAQHHATFEADPLVLLDGVPIFNHNAFMAFDPLRIQRVGVFTTRYFNSSQSFDGLLSFTTYQGDLQGYPLDPRILLEEYEAVQGQREFFAPRYETAQQHQSPLPDRRNLLHWQPNITLAPGATQEVTFYTSDQVGRYVVVVQGVAANGRTGSASTVLEVKPTL